MKRNLLFLWLVMPFYHNVSGIISMQIKTPKSMRQVIIHFTHAPHDERHHKYLNAVIEESLPAINNKLTADGWIGASDNVPPNSNLFERIKLALISCYHTLYHRPMHSLKYPKKANHVFFTRTDKDFGLYTMQIPDGVPYKVFVDELEAFFTKKGVVFHIDADIPIKIAQWPDIGLEGKSLTLEELEQFKKPIATKQLLATLKKKLTKSAQDQQKISNLEYLIDKYNQMKDALFWHYYFPTTGLMLKKPFYPPPYPYLPHFFYLWQLAPRKGEGVKVAVIDTGVAAYGIKDDPAYRKNRDLLIKEKPNVHSFNLVSENGLDPIEQLILQIKPYIDVQKFKEEYLEKMLPNWIISFLKKNDTHAIEKYLIQNGKKELVKNGKLSDKGNEALIELTQGRYGIKPKNDSTIYIKNVRRTL
jgi:hypothetical protein